MKEVERKETAEVAGGEVDAIGNPVPIAHPIYPVPIEPPDLSPMISPESTIS